MPNQYKFKGFTLVELLIVIAIIGILSSIAIPRYQTYSLRATRADEALPFLNELMFAQERFAAENGSYTTDFEDLGYLSSTLLTPKGKYIISAAICGSGIAECVVLTAIAQGTQTDDQNGNGGDISYNSQGIKIGL